MADMVFVGDVGTKIVLNVTSPDDISAATGQVINYKKPDGTTGTWNAVLEDNTIYYITQLGDIDQAGTWKLQGFMQIGGWQGCSSIAKMTVYSKLV